MEKREFSMVAFFLSFTYYFSKKEWLLGVISWVVSSALPIYFYFLVSFILSTLAFKKGITFGKTGSKGVTIACISMALYIAIKLVFY